jgi:hypothetical protein
MQLARLLPRPVMTPASRKSGLQKTHGIAETQRRWTRSATTGRSGVDRATIQD